MTDVPPYSRYASLYDQTGQTEFVRWAWPYVLAHLRRLDWHGERVLDLACGTGWLVPILVEGGFRALGADLSREMLLNGLDRAGGRLLQADFRALPLATGSLDLVTSFYDSVNYLTHLGDLAAMLAEVARVLRPGGYFVFDLNTRHTLSEHWQGICQTRLADDLATIWEATWDETTNVSSLRATFFVRGDDGRWDRFDEVHDERGFTSAELDRAIRAAGLKVAHVEDYHARRKPTGDSRRVFYWLKRRKG
ncbi:MAG: class I SAM-dependent methyltransferase [Armatimonadetes bacterium]|nr:class I SAM-dependent methyltransferase [Armatimonadota bacterium]